MTKKDKEREQSIIECAMWAVLDEISEETIAVDNGVKATYLLKMLESYVYLKRTLQVGKHKLETISNG